MIVSPSVAFSTACPIVWQGDVEAPQVELSAPVAAFT
jgi:hypothetical protein